MVDDRPKPGFEAIRGYVAFYAGKVDEAWVGEERATPQPGGFYGGWVRCASSVRSRASPAAGRLVGGRGGVAHSVSWQPPGVSVRWVDATCRVRDRRIRAVPRVGVVALSCPGRAGRRRPATSARRIRARRAAGRTARWKSPPSPALADPRRHRARRAGPAPARSDARRPGRRLDGHGIPRSDRVHRHAVRGARPGLATGDHGQGHLPRRPAGRPDGGRLSRRPGRCSERGGLQAR